jgi:hypothetical protein
MTRRPLVEFASEHPDFPRWGSPEFAPVQGPTRLTLMQNESLHAITEWYCRRLRGEVLGPLELHRDCWARLVGESGGWPSGAEAVGHDAECRNAEPDAVIGSAGGSLLIPS